MTHFLTIVTVTVEIPPHDLPTLQLVKNIFAEAYKYCNSYVKNTLSKKNKNWLVSSERVWEQLLLTASLKSE